MNASDYLENKLVDWLFRGLSYTPPTTLYVALATAVPTDATTGSTLAEVSGGNYARMPIASSTLQWTDTSGNQTGLASAGTSGTTQNVNAVSWNNVTWNATVNALALVDSATTLTGNILVWSALQASKVVSSGDSVSLAANTGIVIQVDN